MALANYTESEFRRVLELFACKIRFIDRQLIPNDLYREALFLTKDVDIDDTEFVVLTLHLDGKLWSGDKTLRTGLIAKGWNKSVSVDELTEQKGQ